MEERPKRAITVVGIVVGVVLGLVALGGGGYLLVTNPETTAVLRDVFIIVLALESIVIGALLSILIIQIQNLTRLLQEEIKPILDSTNETVSTVRGTAAFVSENVISPMIEAASYVSAVKKVFTLLFPRRRPHPEDQEPPHGPPAEG
ncbi:MAG: hypothetical protein NUW24_06725 [Anaerolineae bacterium]|jgi:hypothetical protein|nr:hypothetical protein [Anaerolineae bacterium]MDH7473222.1 hypothetical protein [Anaerolineae bacterium]